MGQEKTRPPATVPGWPSRPARNTAVSCASQGHAIPARHPVAGPTQDDNAPAAGEELLTAKRHAADAIASARVVAETPSASDRPGSAQLAGPAAAGHPSDRADRRAGHWRIAGVNPICEPAGSSHPGQHRQCKPLGHNRPYGVLAREPGPAPSLPGRVYSANRPELPLPEALGDSNETGEPHPPPHPRQRLRGHTDQGQPYWFLGILTITKVSSDQCDGQLGIFDHRVPPGFAPPHLHHHSDVALLVLDGQLEGFCGVHRCRAGPARWYSCPRDPARLHRLRRRAGQDHHRDLSRRLRPVRRGRRRASPGPAPALARPRPNPDDPSQTPARPPAPGVTGSTTRSARLNSEPARQP